MSVPWHSRAAKETNPVVFFGTLLSFGCAIVTITVTQGFHVDMLCLLLAVLGSPRWRQRAIFSQAVPAVLRR